MSEAVATTRGPAKLACFESFGQTYGIDVLSVREIVRSREVTPLPHAPPLIEGVIDLRDTVVPVLDLGRALAGHAVEDWNEGRIAVLEVDGLVFGLRVDSATEVLDVDPALVETAPDLATRAGYRAVSSVVRRPGSKPVLVLSLEHLLAPLNEAGEEEDS